MEDDLPQIDESNLRFGLRLFGTDQFEHGNLEKAIWAFDKCVRTPASGPKEVASDYYNLALVVFRMWQSFLKNGNLQISPSFVVWAWRVLAATTYAITHIEELNSDWECDEGLKRMHAEMSRKQEMTYSFCAEYFRKSDYFIEGGGDFNKIFALVRQDAEFENGESGMLALDSLDDFGM